MSFTYDPANDVVDAAFRDVILETEEDVLCWRREVERRFQRYGRPVDLIIDLEGLIVKPSAARSFGAHRAEVLAEHTRVSYRFNGNLQTRTSIYTSAVIHGADANVYESRDEALKALIANRSGPMSFGPRSTAPLSSSPRSAPLSSGVRPTAALSSSSVPPPSTSPPAAVSPGAPGPISIRPMAPGTAGPMSSGTRSRK